MGEAFIEWALNFYYIPLHRSYAGVKIENFSSSWKNGLGFNALIHSHRPDLINYNALDPKDHIGNLNNAFNVAENKLGIARLLDAEGEAPPICDWFFPLSEKKPNYMM